MNVYDFDNTIYRGESGVDLFRYYMRRDPSLLKKLPDGIKLVARYKMGKIDMQGAFAGALQQVEDYVSRLTTLDEDMVDFWKKNIHKIKPWYFKQRRDDDLIISAGPEVSLQVICKHLNIKRFIGSRYDQEAGRITFVCLRDNKVQAFREQYPDEQIENLYTDSYNDKPLMEISDNVFMVKGNAIKQIKRDGEMLIAFPA